MAAATDQRLERAILAAERAGKVVVRARVDLRENVVVLDFAQPGQTDTTRADLIDWRPG